LDELLIWLFSNIYYIKYLIFINNKISYYNIIYIFIIYFTYLFIIII
jgi:hypothetical protein